MRKPNLFLKELDEQPEALRRLVEYYSGKGFPRLKQWARLAKKNQWVIFSGMGTSEFAPEMILPDLARNGIGALTIDAGEWLHYPRPLKGLPVLISQSGESVETRKLAERLRMPFIGLTNNESSLLGRKASLALPMCAGAESAISTKTYVNTLALLYLMARAIQGEKKIKEGLIALKKAANRMNECDRANIFRAASVLASASCIQFVGRGPAMAAVKQTALTFMEGTRLSTTALTGGAFRHGPFELAGKGHHIVFFAPHGFTLLRQPARDDSCRPGKTLWSSAGRNGVPGFAGFRRDSPQFDAGCSTFNLLSAMAVETAGKGSSVVVITDAEMKAKSGMKILSVPNLGEDLFPIAAALTQELLLYETAKRRNLEAGKFRYGSKITARE